MGNIISYIMYYHIYIISYHISHIAIINNHMRNIMSGIIFHKYHMGIYHEMDYHNGINTITIWEISYHTLCIIIYIISYHISHIGIINNHIGL